MAQPETTQPETKKCDACGVTIAKSETKCPACKRDQLDDEDISVVERAIKILDGRKVAPAPTPANQPPASRSRFAALRELRKKKG